jgi:hypothetical protein
MSSSVCTDQEIQAFLNESLGDIPGNLTCEYLKAEHGISLGIQQDGFFLTRENRLGRPMLKASLSKASGALIGPMIAVLDSKSANGLVILTLRVNIRDCAPTSSVEWRVKARNMLSTGDYIGVLIMLASNESCDFKNLAERIKAL